VARLLLTCALLCALALRAPADDLLGSVNRVYGGGSDVAYTGVRSISFEFGYDISTEGPPCVRQRVGCEPIPIAQAVTGAIFTCTPGTSQHFGDVAAELTNGVNEQLWYVDRLFGPRGDVIAGGGSGGATESATFHVATDLTGYTITSIQLTLNHFALGPNSLCGGGTPGGLCYQVDATWRFYGVPSSTPARPASWGAVKSFYR
jgi:hypothetical protein